MGNEIQRPRISIDVNEDIAEGIKGSAAELDLSVREYVLRAISISQELDLLKNRYPNVSFVLTEGAEHISLQLLMKLLSSDPEISQSFFELMSSKNEI